MDVGVGMGIKYTLKFLLTVALKMKLQKRKNPAQIK